MSTDDQDIAVARLVRQSGMATPEQIAQGIALQGKAIEKGEPISLAEALVRAGILSPADRDRVEKRLEARRGSVQQLLDYRLIRKLGEGGMGAVYLAEDTRDGRQVALKVLTRRHSADDGFIRRFRREVEASTRLRHPNIVRAFEAGEDLGLHFYVMEYCEGESLDRALKRQGPFPWRQALDFVLQAARGLEYAHHEGFIHRDIKPANIFVTTGGTAKILDLGLARRLDTSQVSILTVAGSVIGTPHYISPEQARGLKEIDGRSDIYSLGAAFYHLLTGELPFSGTTLYEVLAKQVGAELPNPQDIVEDVPDGVVLVLRKMMAKGVSDRYPDCGTLIRDMVLVLNGEEPRGALMAPDASSVAIPRAGAPGARRRHPRTYRVPLVRPRTGKRAPLLWAGAAAAVLLVIVLAAAFGGKGSPPRPPPANPVAKAVPTAPVPPEPAPEADRPPPKPREEAPVPREPERPPTTRAELRMEEAQGKTVADRLSSPLPARPGTPEEAAPPPSIPPAPAAEPPAPGEAPAAGSPQDVLWKVILENREKLLRQPVVLRKAGFERAAYTVKDIAEGEIVLDIRMDGATAEARERPGTAPAGLFRQLLSKAVPDPGPGLLKTIALFLAGRGDFDPAHRELDQARAAGADTGTEVRTILGLELAAIEKLKTPAARSAALRKILDSRGPCLDDGLKADLRERIATEEFSKESLNTRASGLLAWWRFDEGRGTVAYDSSGNGHTGTLRNAPAWVPGRIGSALQFNDVNTYVEVPSAPALTPQAITIAAWVCMPVQSNYDGNVVSKGIDGYRLRFWHHGGFGFIDRGGSGTTVSTTVKAPPDEWTHIAMSGDATGVRLYMNGVQAGSRKEPFSPAANSHSVQIGALTDFGVEHFNGLIDDVRIYGRALGLLEIRGLIALAGPAPARARK